MNSQPFGCVNNTIRLRSGKYLDLADPKPDQFDFADIAGGLSKLCRFGGQCERFYSVAEHSYHCAMQAKLASLTAHVQLAVLLHDAAEAFIGDVVKPLKIMLPDYRAVERNMERAVGEKYGIDWAVVSDEVTRIDRAMLIAERLRMFTRDDVTWTGENEVERLQVDFKFYPPNEAEAMFSIRAMELGLTIDGASILR